MLFSQGRRPCIRGSDVATVGQTAIPAYLRHEVKRPFFGVPLSICRTLLKRSTGSLRSKFYSARAV